MQKRSGRTDCTLGCGSIRNNKERVTESKPVLAPYCGVKKKYIYIIQTKYKYYIIIK